MQRRGEGNERDTDNLHSEFTVNADKFMPFLASWALRCVLVVKREWRGRGEGVEWQEGEHEGGLSPLLQWHWMGWTRVSGNAACGLGSGAVSSTGSCLTRCRGGAGGVVLLRWREGRGRGHHCLGCTRIGHGGYVLISFSSRAQFFGVMSVRVCYVYVTGRRGYGVVCVWCPKWTPWSTRPCTHA